MISKMDKTPRGVGIRRTSFASLRVLMSGTGSEAGFRVGPNGFVGVLLVEAADLLVARHGAALLPSSYASRMVMDGESALVKRPKELRLMKGSGRRST